MKRKTQIMLFLAVILFLCSCGQQSNAGSVASANNDSAVSSNRNTGPSDEQLQMDIQDSLSQYHSGMYGYDVSISEYEIERSLAGDTGYSAQLNVTAKSLYAEFQYVANVDYTRYDQGWMIDKCEWTMSNYEVVRYPDEAELQLMKEQQDVSESAEIEITSQGGYFSYTGKLTSQWNQFIKTEYEVTITWVFDIYSDGWLFESKTSHNEQFEFTKSLEGTWNLSEEKYLSKGKMVISDVDGSGFDMQLITNHYSTEVFHVDISSCNWDINEDWFLTLHWEDSGITYNEEVGAVYLNLSFYKNAHILSGQSYTSRWLIYVGPNYLYTSSAYI